MRQISAEVCTYLWDGLESIVDIVCKLQSENNCAPKGNLFSIAHYLHKTQFDSMYLYKEKAL